MRRFPGKFWMVAAGPMLLGALLLSGCDDTTLTKPEPHCMISPASVQFGEVELGTSKNLSFTVKNDGGTSLNGRISVNCDRFSIVAGGGDYSLSPGDTMRVDVRFQTADPGNFECDLDVGTPCGNQIHLTGSGARVVVPPPDNDDHFVPAPVSDLAVIHSSSTTLTLRWTATGDDNFLGQAALYDLRMSTNAQATWENSIPVVGFLPAPGAAGYVETYTVTDLTPLTTYYFWIMVADEASNRSERSNRAIGTTIPDVVGPGRIDDLGENPEETSDTTIGLTWTAPEGTDNESYDIRYATMEATSWDEMLPVEGEPAPGIPGTTQAYTVTDLQQETTYYFEIRTLDGSDNISPRSNRLIAQTQSD